MRFGDHNGLELRNIGNQPGEADHASLDLCHPDVLCTDLCKVLVEGTAGVVATDLGRVEDVPMPLGQLHPKPAARVEIVRQSLLITGLKSDGSDLRYTESDLDDTTPYTISVETATRLNANESVLVLAGSEVGIGTALDDMHCKMNAVLWWQLKKLVIDMAVDVIP